MLEPGIVAAAVVAMGGAHAMIDQDARTELLEAARATGGGLVAMVPSPVGGTVAYFGVRFTGK